jgi:signal transduction histidine kinase
VIRCGGERSDVELRLPVELLGEQYGLGSFYLEEEIGSGELFLDGEVITELVIDIDSSELLEDLDPETDKQVDDPDLVEELEEALFDVRVLDGLEGDAESVRLLVGATALDEVDTSLRAVRRALLVGVPILILVLGVLTWLLVGRALRPVQRISERVDEISSANLHEDGSERQRQLSADASHELRSPLSTIRAAAEMIGRSPGGPRISELVDDITAESDRMDVLIGGLLMLSRLDEQRLDIGSDSLDLAALVHAVVADVIADDVGIAIDTGAVEHVDGVVINGLPSLVRQVPLNLIENAVRHASARVNVVVTMESGEAVLVVEDDGGGIAEADLDRVFDRFVRLDEARGRDAGGFGLGLALVRAVVGRHGGTISAGRSTELGGARMEFRLPLANG